MADTGAEHPEMAARMVDIGAKSATERTARASCVVRMTAATADRIRSGDVSKGDVLEVARVAGLMASKRTADLIPLCHPIAITHASVAFSFTDEGVLVETEVKTLDRTGVEMEALTAASVAALTVYDMVKSIEREVEITDVRVEAKSGGRSGDFTRPAEPG